jgi:glycosyltransferase involved in cell wall biosynthesis/ubiquinone/menaquinone biosynthesis C-methylase UbiE
VALCAKRCGVAHLHAHYAKEPLEVAARVRWLTGIPYSFAAHAKDLYTSPPQRLGRRLRKARFAVTCHRHGEATLQKLADPADRDRILHVPHGLDRRIFSPDPSAKEHNLIVAVGRLTQKKGFDTLIAACEILQQKDRSFRCVIFGEGRLRSQLKSSIQAASLTGVVELRGFLPQEELASWYRRAAVVALPARVTADGNRDGIPNVLLEALACGTAVVSTPVGSIGEVIEDEKNGLLVPPDDAQALARALERLLEQPQLRRGLETLAAVGAENQDFRRRASPLIERFQNELDSRMPARLSRRRHEAWDKGGMAERAAARLGRRPRNKPQVEAAIENLVQPGLRANAWRPDLEHMIDRRLWDEVFKAKRAKRIAGLARRATASDQRRPRVLDLGCGRGGLTVALRANGVSTLALDLRLRNCRVTRLRGRRYDLRLPVFAGRAEDLPFADNSFDAVSLLEVLEHVQDPIRLLAEVRRVCRPGGVCLITVVNRWAHLDPHYRLWGVNFLPRRLAQTYISLRGRGKRSWADNQELEDMHYFSFSRFRRLAAALGFEVLDPQAPEQPVRSLFHRLGRKLSLGFNTMTLVLRPCEVQRSWPARRQTGTTV